MGQEDAELPLLVLGERLGCVRGCLGGGDDPLTLGGSHQPFPLPVRPPVRPPLEPPFGDFGFWGFGAGLLFRGAMSHRSPTPGRRLPPSGPERLQALCAGPLVHAVPEVLLAGLAVGGAVVSGHQESVRSVGT